MKYLKYILISLIVIIPCILTVLIYNDKITQNSPVYYKKGVEFYDEGDYANAYYNFGKIKKISPLYKMALYKQAKSAQKGGDFKTAALKYELFLKKSPNSPFYTKAKLNLAKCYFYLKQYEQAKLCFEELNEKNNNKGTEEVYFLGLLEKSTNKEKAANYFREYLNQALKGNALNNNYIIPAANELANLGITLTNEDIKTIGIAYFKNKEYKQSLEYFSKLPMADSWDYLVLANHYAGNKVIAKKLIENGLIIYYALAEENNLNEIYNIYVSYLTGTKQKNWTFMLKTVKNNSLKGEDYVMYKLASILPKDSAIALYNNIFNKYPESNYAPESLWYIFWDKYKKKDYKAAENLAIKHLNLYKNAKSTPKILFWLAKTYFKENKISEAHNYLSKLISKYPDNYYGLRAENILEKSGNFWAANSKNLIPEQKDDIEFPLSVSQINIKEIKVINTLFEIGDYEIWLDADFSNPIVESWFEQRKDNKTRSIILARDEIEKADTKPLFISTEYKLAYPRYWVSEINTAGSKLGIDPYLILAIMKEESHFNEHARSKTGALGLMQLMPQTANYMITKLTDETNSLANLEDPRINMFIGCNYLKYLKERFNNDLYVIAAYNGGEGSVNKWIKSYNTDDYDEFIEDIPYEETKNYIKKIYRTYHIYRKIYK